MGDLKLYDLVFVDYYYIEYLIIDDFIALSNFIFHLNFFFYDFFFQLLNFFDPILQNGFFVSNSKLYYQFPQNMVFFFALKFCFALALLILIRGGTPRYRYDYLTKLGWLKFLGFIIAIFFLSLLLFFLF